MLTYAAKQVYANSPISAPAVILMSTIPNISSATSSHSHADSELQLDLLGDKNQDMTLEEVVQFVEAKESTKRSAGHPFQAQGADAARSQY